MSDVQIPDRHGGYYSFYYPFGSCLSVTPEKSHRRTTPPSQCRGPRAERRIPYFAALPQTPDGGSNDFGIWVVIEAQDYNQ